jgi:hypothetical protein
MFRSVVGLEIKAAAVSWMPWRRISSAMTDVPTFVRGDFLPSPLDPFPLGDGAVCVFSMTYGEVLFRAQGLLWCSVFTGLKAGASTLASLCEADIKRFLERN